MKTMIVTAVLAAGLFALQDSASAQTARVYKYCLQEGGVFRGGTGQILCRYDTLAQCWASRTGPADFRYYNTAYPGPQKSR
jgi:hypothetical protein